MMIVIGDGNSGETNNKGSNTRRGSILIPREVVSMMDYRHCREIKVKRAEISSEVFWKNKTLPLFFDELMIEW